MGITMHRTACGIDIVNPTRQLERRKVLEGVKDSSSCHKELPVGKVAFSFREIYACCSDV